MNLVLDCFILISVVSGVYSSLQWEMVQGGKWYTPNTLKAAKVLASASWDIWFSSCTNTSKVTDWFSWAFITHVPWLSEKANDHLSHCVAPLLSTFALIHAYVNHSKFSYACPLEEVSSKTAFQVSKYFMFFFSPWHFSWWWMGRLAEMVTLLC